MKPMFSNFTIAIKIDCLFLAIFQSFYWLVSFIFDKLAPPPRIYVSKDALNHFLVHTSAKKDSLRSAKNVLFSLFAFWSTGQWGGGGYSSPPWLRYWNKQWLLPYKATFTLDCAFWSVLQLRKNYSTLIIWSAYSAIRHHSWYNLGWQRYDNILVLSL